ncbi:unnamed protein product [Cylindrotheca closterium]|uniref:DNA (cytosine-5-)-methyltransferase n=1 Tax=Cylindrotheca closterium TaxID=2856 RepID=A0AAD2CQW8_9STRA|nr:unnamed protein product [Cylindrotheca closterium]
MVQTTLTQKFRRVNPEKGDDDSNIDQDDADAEELDESAVHLTQVELQSFTQKWDIFTQYYDEDNEVPDDQPDRIDFSQAQLTQPAADEEENAVEEEEVHHQRGPKRTRHNEFHLASLIQRVPVDTENKWHLDVDGTWKMFKVGERFSIGAQVDTRHPEIVYTIQDFFHDPKVGKMAMCHVAILAQATFIGKENPVFSVRDFEKKFGSRYVSCRYSQTKPLRKLHRIIDTTGIVAPNVYFDPPTRQTKRPGWTNAFSFNQSFGTNETCLIAESPNALDGFAGGGGVSHALELAGFKVTHAIDNEPIAVATLKLNHIPEDTRVVDQDINSFIDDALEAHANPNDPYNCDGTVHVHLSPPCQGFSRMNTTESEASKEKNNQLSLTFPRLVIGIKSTTGSFENVTGMLDDDRVHYVQRIAYEFIMNDDQVRVGILDSSEYGDPQKRQRVVMFVSKKGWKLPDLPEPTHGPARPLEPLQTPKDAIGDLEQVIPRNKPGILALPPRKSGSDGSERIIEVDHHVIMKSDDDRDCYSKTDSLVANKPANTVLCGHAIKQYKLNRACTNLEGARLQSFPDDYKFAGNPKQVQKQIGNAVPICLGTAIAKAVYSVYDVDPYLFDSPPDDALELPKKDVIP